MRVIAGSARSLRLKTLDGMETRPTTDRIKETLFNIIGPTVYDSIFLDLFSGSGGIGIEALSRGAKEAVFVEKNPKAVPGIRETLKFTRLEPKAVPVTGDVLDACTGWRVKKYLILFLWILLMTEDMKNRCSDIWQDRRLYMKIQ